MVHVAGGEGGSIRHDPARPRSRRCRLEIEPLLHSLAQRPSPSMRCGSQSKSQGGVPGGRQHNDRSRRAGSRASFCSYVGNNRRQAGANPENDHEHRHRFTLRRQMSKAGGQPDQGEVRQTSSPMPSDLPSRSRAPSRSSRCAPTRQPSGSSMRFRPTLSVRSTWRARSPRPCSPVQNGSWTGHQRFSRPRSSPPSCPSEQRQFARGRPVCGWFPSRTGHERVRPQRRDRSGFDEALVRLVLGWSAGPRGVAPVR
jgi:hypothetical protein